MRPGRRTVGSQAGGCLAEATGPLGSPQPGACRAGANQTRHPLGRAPPAPPQAWVIRPISRLHKKAACDLLRLRKTQEWHSSRIFLYLLCVLTHWPYTPLDSHLLRPRVGTLPSPPPGTGQCWQQRPAQPASGAEAFDDVTSFCPHNSPTGRKFLASVLLCSSPDCAHTQQHAMGRRWERGL